MRICINIFYRLIIKLNTFFLKNKYNKIDQGASVYFKSKIINHVIGGIRIGKHTNIGRSEFKYHAGLPFYSVLLNDGVDSHIYIGDNCRINGAYIHAKDFIEIGDNCVMASGINIIDSNAHEVHSPNRTKGCDNPQGIKIGNNVWVGLNVIVLKGSVVGDNCVISAGSIVKGEFPENSIIQGNPAKIVGTVKITDK